VKIKGEIRVRFDLVKKGERSRRLGGRIKRGVTLHFSIMI
jgi:hypothetical protein